MKLKMSLAVIIILVSLCAGAQPKNNVLRARHAVPSEFIVTFDKRVPPAAAVHVIAAHHGRIIAPFPDINAYWIHGAGVRLEALASAKV